MESLKYSGMRVTEKTVCIKKQEEIRFKESLLTFGLESFVFPVVLCVYPGACLNTIVIPVFKNLNLDGGFSDRNKYRLQK
jgi:hypothetical protein